MQVLVSLWLKSPYITGLKASVLRTHMINSQSEMVIKEQKLAGDNSVDDNNKRAFLCNPAFSRKGDGYFIEKFDQLLGWFHDCSDEDKTKNICYGQAKILQQNLEKIIPLLDDKWQVLQQSNKNHDWVNSLRTVV